MCMPSASKHFTIYNPTLRPSPAANHSAFFDYSAEVNNKNSIMFMHCEGVTVKIFMTSSKGQLVVA